MIILCIPSYICLHDYVIFLIVQRIYLCRYVFTITITFSSGPSNCSDGEIRPMEGENELEGRVEICCNGVWGTVCDNGWDATVICNQLGFGQSGIILIISTCVHIDLDQESLEVCCLSGVASQNHVDFQFIEIHGYYKTANNFR